MFKQVYDSNHSGQCFWTRITIPYNAGLATNINEKHQSDSREIIILSSIDINKGEYQFDHRMLKSKVDAEYGVNSIIFIKNT